MADVPPPPPRHDRAIVEPPRSDESSRAEDVTLSAGKTRAFTFRAIFFGTMLALIVNLVTPYNDFVVANTFFVGSYLPLALILAVFGLVIGGNSLYRAWRPDRAFGTGEMSLVLLMLLVSCSFPSQGLMRGLLPTITAPFYHGQTSNAFWNGFIKADLPAWLFPVSPLSAGRASEVIQNFYAKVPDGEAVPYAAWLAPMLGWGVFFLAFFAVLIAIAYVLRIQWAENERLPFPLAQLQYSLIEAPEPGRLLNRLFRRKSFWIVTAIVFLIRSSNAAHLYDARFPELLVGYDFRRVLTERPWNLLSYTILSSPIYFTFIGMAFFIRSRTAFSIWAIYLIMQLYALVRTTAGYTAVSSQETNDQHLGACVAFAVGMLWIGRSLFWQLARGTIGLSHTVTDRGAVFAARVAIVGLIVMFAWFAIVGASAWLAIITIGILLLAHVVTSRIVAETGMPYTRTGITVTQVAMLPPAASVSPRDLFLAGAFTQSGTFGTRESVMGFAQQGMRVMDEADAMPTRRPWLLATVLLWTLVISYAASSWSSLTCYYHYVTPISPHSQFTVLNQDITVGQTRVHLQQNMEQLQSGTFSPRGYEPWTRLAAGFGIVAVLQISAWSFAAWPLLPVGFLMSGSVYIGASWFSIFLGWLAKVTLIKCGGAKALESLKPAFIGMIFGESLAAALWMIVSLVLAMNGYDYRPYSALPT